MRAIERERIEREGERERERERVREYDIWKMNGKVFNDITCQVSPY